MSKSVIIFGVVMSIVYVCFGLFLLLASVYGNTNINFQYQNVLGGLLMGYGVFRVIRGVKQYQNFKQNAGIEGSGR